jgi:hypothetical protein
VNLLRRRNGFTPKLTPITSTLPVVLVRNHAVAAFPGSALRLFLSSRRHQLVKLGSMMPTEPPMGLLQLTKTA